MQKTTYTAALAAMMLSLCWGNARAQMPAAIDTVAAKTSALMAAPGKGFTKAVTALDGKYNGIAGQVDRQPAGYLGKLQKQELAPRKKMQALDSNRAEQVLGCRESFYAGLAR